MVTTRPSIDPVCAKKAINGIDEREEGPLWFQPQKYLRFYVVQESIHFLRMQETFTRLQEEFFGDY